MHVSPRLTRVLILVEVAALCGAGYLLARRIEDPAEPPGWVATFGGPVFDQIEAFDADADGNLYLLGGYRGPVDFDPGPGEALRVLPGVEHSDGKGHCGMALVSLDPLGHHRWTTSWETWPADGAGIVVTSRGEVYGLAGSGGLSNVREGDQDPRYLASQTHTMLFRIDSSGQMTRETGWLKDVRIYELIADPSTDGIVVRGVGPSGPASPANTWPYAAFIQRFEKSRGLRQILEWETVELRDPFNDAAVDGEGNLYFAGSLSYVRDLDPSSGVLSVPRNQPDAPSMTISSFSAEGDLRWARPWLSELGLMDVSAEGECYIASSGGKVWKLNPAGHQVWRCNTALDDVVVSDMAVTTDGRVCLAGFGNFIPELMRAGVLSPGDDFSQEAAFVAGISRRGKLKWVHAAGAVTDFAYRGDIGYPLAGAPRVAVGKGVYVAGPFTGAVDFDRGPGEQLRVAPPINPGLNTDHFVLHLQSDGTF